LFAGQSRAEAWHSIGGRPRHASPSLHVRGLTPMSRASPERNIAPFSDLYRREATRDEIRPSESFLRAATNIPQLRLQRYWKIAPRFVHAAPRANGRKFRHTYAWCDTMPDLLPKPLCNPKTRRNTLTAHPQKTPSPRPPATTPSSFPNEWSLRSCACHSSQEISEWRHRPQV
jgi:hypothetical protein